MTAHIRNFRLQHLKIHCFRSITHVASNEKVDDAQILTQLNCSHPTYRYQGLLEILNSQTDSNKIQQLKSANCTGNLILFYPKSTSLHFDKVHSLSLSNDRKEKRHCIGTDDRTPERLTKACDSDAQENKCVSHILCDFILQKSYSDSLILNEGQVKSRQTERLSRKNYGLHRLKNVVGQLSKQTTLHTKIANQFEVSRSVCSTPTLYSVEPSVKREWMLKLNCPATDSSIWTLHYCLQVNGGNSSDKGRVDRSMFPKGKPEISTLENTQAALEELLQVFFHTRESFDLMRRLHYDDVIFINKYSGQVKRTYGKPQYLAKAVLFQMAMKMKHPILEWEVQSVFMDPDKATIKIHWRIYYVSVSTSVKSSILTIFRFQTQEQHRQDSKWMEGVSTFHIGEDGRVFKHVLDGLVPEDKGIAISKSWKSWLAEALGLPKPSIANSKIDKVKFLT